MVLHQDFGKGDLDADVFVFVLDNNSTRVGMDVVGYGCVGCRMSPLISCEKQLYKRLFSSVGQSVGPSVRRFSKTANSREFNKIQDFLQLLAG